MCGGSRRRARSRPRRAGQIRGAPPRTPAVGSGLPPAARGNPDTEPRRGSGGGRSPVASPCRRSCKATHPQGQRGEEILRPPPAPKKLQLGGAPRAAPPPFARRHQRGVPTRGGWGRGEAGPGPGSLPAAAVAPPGSRRSQPGGSLASAPCVPSRRTRKSEAARGYGEELRSSYRRWKPDCCINHSLQAATSFAGIIYFLLQVLFNFDPIAAVRALASPLPPKQRPRQCLLP